MRIFWLDTVDYIAAWDLQRHLAEARAAGLVPDLLLLLQHPPTLTLGRGAKREHLLASDDALAAQGVNVYDVDRGGDITYHGPGQLVGYPILDLGSYGRDLHGFLRRMEGALMRSLAAFGLSASRFPPHTGVWLDDRKVAAMGIHVRRWVTTHGFALNVAPRMEHFRLIVPCGIHDFGVTSLAEVLSQTPAMSEVASIVAREFVAEFPSPDAAPGWQPDGVPGWPPGAVELHPAAPSPQQQ